MDDASAPSKIGQETETPEGRGADGRFQPGNPGGPGRREGSRNKATALLDKMAEDDANDIGRKVIDAAKAGDMRAAELVLSRIWPARKGGRPIAIELPKIQTAADVVKALGSLADAVAGGELTPDEGAAVAAIFETKRRAIETVELEGRVAALEQERK